MSAPAAPPPPTMPHPRRRVYELRLEREGWVVVTDPLEAGRYARMSVHELDALAGALRCT